MEANEKFEPIRHYFTNDAWILLSDLEKQVFCNMKANYDKLTELGKFNPTFHKQIRDMPIATNMAGFTNITNDSNHCRC